MIIVDGVFFQINSTGIARVWETLLRQWVKSGFANQIIVLDRNNTAPKIDGINYYQIEGYDYRKSAIDAYNLQSICDKFKADIFISTYYTTPLFTPSVLLVHDMIPEVLGMDLEAVEWKEKHYAILYASKYIAVSRNTARDLQKFFPFISSELITVVYNGIDSIFYPAKSEEISNFKQKYNLYKPYFLFVGTRLSYDNYKNAILLFRAFNRFSRNQDIGIVCVGGDRNLRSELASLVKDNMKVDLIKIDDHELRSAYSGAISLVYPSRYEGFGLPILEAMACGCPVITCANSSIPEVAGKEAIYVSESNVEEMLIAFEKVQNPQIREILIKSGLERVKQFSWSKMSKIMAEVLMQTAQEYKLNDNQKNDLLWQKIREEQKQKQKLQFLTNENNEKISSLEIEINKLNEKIEYLSTSKGLLKTFINKIINKINLKKVDFD